MKKQKVIIYGLGEFAKQMHWYFTHDSDYEIVCFCGDAKYINGDTFCNLPVHCFEKIEDYYPITEYYMFVAVGYASMRNRKEMFSKAQSKGYNFINYISSDSNVSQHVDLGHNNAILAGALLEQNVVIGNNNIIWSNSTICHDVKIKSHNFIAAGSVIGGFTKIHNNCFIGFNSTIINNLIIQDETLIGAGSVHLNNTPPNTKWYGNPSKLICSHDNKGIIIK